MKEPLYFILTFMLFFTLLVDHQTLSVTSSCNGSIAECNEDKYEMLMESEISKRLLAERKYIAPGALKRDQPVCSTSGGDAYSKNEGCLPPPANPYTKGCSRFYRCRSDS
ncbi:hypothetical protein ACFE04_004160 [Oxalis oulophora]